jgi:hypothetical protein
VFRIDSLTALALVLLSATSTAAAGADEPAHPCAAVEDSVDRLACYDAAFARPGVTAGPQQDSDATPGTPGAVEEFGLSEAQLQARDPERARPPRVDHIEAQVVDVRLRSTGERIITLDNGQVWLQTEVTVRGPLSAGDRVVIRSAALGSFQLVTPGRVALRVRRIE